MRELDTQFFLSHNIPVDLSFSEKLPGGKDNLTYQMYLMDGTPIVVQYMRSIHGMKHREFLENLLLFVTTKFPEIGFAKNIPNLSRFYDYDGAVVQIMEKASGRIITEQDINDHLIAEIGRRLAVFHCATETFDFESFSDINFHRDRVSEFKLQSERFAEKHRIPEIQDLVARYKKAYDSVTFSTENIRKGVIHGDPAFKNFLIDASGEICAWIDYDMLSVTYQLWDLADAYRAFAKLTFDKSFAFTEKQAKILLDAYQKVRPLTADELKALPNFIKMMALDTGYRYILSLDSESGFYNEMWDSIAKAERSLRDFARADEWFM